MTRVMCIASHPDDEVLGVGGTLLRHIAEGDEVTVVLMHHCTRAASWTGVVPVATQYGRGLHPPARRPRRAGARAGARGRLHAPSR